MCDNINKDNEKVFLDDQEITRDELNEKVNNLKANQRITEVQNNKFVTLERMNGYEREYIHECLKIIKMKK